LEKIIDLLSRISALYNIPQWIVNSGAVAIVVILIASPFVVRYLMQPKYYKFREMILFKVLWRWKYKKGEVIGLWCYCPKCQAMLMVDDENCRSEENLQNKLTFFICHECGGNELGRVVGGDRRYVLSLVKRDIWRHIRDGSYNEVASATKGALELYTSLETKEQTSELCNEVDVLDSENEKDAKAVSTCEESDKKAEPEEVKKDGI
jgi:hypothetical protein